jgi:hypothetical protein
MEMNTKNVLSLLGLVFIFGGMLYATNSTYSRQMAGTVVLLERSAASGMKTVGPIVVDYGVCHYILPVSWLDSSVSWILCPSCVSEAEKIRARFDATVTDRPQCARRGTNLMRFQMK